MSKLLARYAHHLWIMTMKRSKTLPYIALSVSVPCILGLTSPDAKAGVVGYRPTNTHEISGRIHHLERDGLVLRVGDRRFEIADGTDRFSLPAAGENMNAVIERQPSGQACAIHTPDDEFSSSDTISIYCQSLVSRPLPLPFMGARVSATVDRAFIPMRVGDENREIEGLVDTGSAGPVLNAFQLFPKSIVSEDGFQFPQGVHRISFNGIIVTDTKFEKRYGGSGEAWHSTIGNLGFAQLSFGRNGELVTGLTPVLLVYKRRTASGTFVLAENDSSTNIIGINGQLNSIQGGDNEEPASSKPHVMTLACDERTLTNCGLASPFRNVVYGANIRPGYLIDPINLNYCSLKSVINCALNSRLMVGLDERETRDFVVARMTCQAGSIGGARPLNVCAANIPNLTISSGGDSFTTKTLFDTGSPLTIINIPPGATFPSRLTAGSMARFAIGSTTVFDANVSEIGANKFSVNPNSSSRSTIGISYFERHAMFMSYDDGLIGLH